MQDGTYPSWPADRLDLALGFIFPSDVNSSTKNFARFYDGHFGLSSQSFLHVQPTTRLEQDDEGGLPNLS